MSYCLNLTCNNHLKYGLEIHLHVTQVKHLLMREKLEFHTAQTIYAMSEQKTIIKSMIVFEEVHVMNSL